jgi:hypothetical protein
MNGRRGLTLVLALVVGGMLAVGPGEATAHAKPEGEMRWAQQLIHDRVRFAAIYDFIWPSGIGPRVEEPALMLIDPYPWSAPLEEVRLRKR